MCGRSSYMRYCSGQIQIPVLPAVIIANEKSLFNEFNMEIWSVLYYYRQWNFITTDFEDAKRIEIMKRSQRFVVDLPFINNIRLDINN